MTLSTKKFITDSAIVSSSQWINLIVSVFTLPWLTHNLGIEKYGQLAVFSATCSFLIIWLDFGISLSGTRSIAKSNSHLKNKIIFTNIQNLKFILSAASMLFIYFINAIFTQLNSPNYSLIICSMIFATINSIDPRWYYDGKQLLAKYAIFTIANRLIQLGMLVSFVKKPNDLPLAMIIECTGNLLPLTLALKTYKKNYFFRLSNKLELIKQARQSYTFFLTNLSISLYTSAIPIVLNITTNHEIVGLYSAADKIISACKRVLTPFFSITYVRWIHLNSTYTKNAKLEMLFFTVLMVILATLTSTALYFFADRIAIELLNEAKNGIVEALKIMSPIPIFAILSHIAGYQVLIPNKKENIQFLVIVYCGFTGLLATLLITKTYGLTSIALIITLVEFLICAFMTYFAANTLWRKYENRYIE